LDILLRWWDEDFIRKFLWYRWVVIVSINEFKEDPNSFWNIIVKIAYNNSEVLLVCKWEDLKEMMYFVAQLWLEPTYINFVNKPVPEQQMKDMLKLTFSKIKEENEKIKQQQKSEELKEKKKYEESWIKDWLRIINSNIDHIEQVMKAWEWILWGSELKELEDYLNEMKKIRLWTNFNKMASVVLDAHSLVKHAEEEIFKTYDSKKFLIDRNSCATNIDVLSEYFDFVRLSEKSKFQPAWLKPTETFTNMLWDKSILLKLLRRDTSYTFENSSFEEIFDIVIGLIEYIILLIIIVISISRLIWSLLWLDKLSLYLLPAMWWLWVLVYLLSNLTLKWIYSRILWFGILLLIYWYWLILLLNTFAL